MISSGTVEFWYTSRILSKG